MYQSFRELALVLNRQTVHKYCWQINLVLAS